MRRIAVTLVCAGLLAACTGPARDPAGVSMGATGTGVGGPGLQGAISAAPIQKSSTATSPGSAKAKSASNPKDRAAGHLKAPKRIAERPAVRKTTTDAKTPAERRPPRPAQEIPLD